MILEELKTWINSLPDRFLQYNVVNAELGELTDDYEYRLDKPVTRVFVDEENKEIVILNNKK